MDQKENCTYSFTPSPSFPISLPSSPPPSPLHTHTHTLFLYTVLSNLRYTGSPTFWQELQEQLALSLSWQLNNLLQKTKSSQVICCCTERMELDLINLQRGRWGGTMWVQSSSELECQNMEAMKDCNVLNYITFFYSWLSDLPLLLYWCKTVTTCCIKADCNHCIWPTSHHTSSCIFAAAEPCRLELIKDDEISNLPADTYK